MTMLNAERSLQFPYIPLRGLRPNAIEIFDIEIDPLRHPGREAVRRQVMTMQPQGPQPTPLPGIDGRGVFWGITAPNGLTLAIRTRNFAEPWRAEQDAAEVLSKWNRIRFHPVEDSVRGQQSLWITLDNAVVLVAARGWRRSEDSVERALLRTFRASPLERVPAGVEVWRHGSW